MPEKYSLTVPATSDLGNIYDYTIDMWGKAQADKYTKQLYDRFKWLSDNPLLGTSRNEIKEGYRSFNEGSHVIFYRVAGGNIEIIGIPHQSMDTLQHFSIENPASPNVAGDGREDD